MSGNVRSEQAAERGVTTPAGGNFRYSLCSIFFYLFLRLPPEAKGSETKIPSRKDKRTRRRQSQYFEEEVKTLLCSLGHTNLPTPTTSASAAHLHPPLSHPSTSSQFHIPPVPHHPITTSSFVVSCLLSSTPNFMSLQIHISPSSTSLHFHIPSYPFFVVSLISLQQPPLYTLIISLLPAPHHSCTPHKFHTYIPAHLSLSPTPIPNLSHQPHTVPSPHLFSPSPAEAFCTLTIALVTCLYITTLIWFPWSRRKGSRRHEAAGHVFRGTMRTMP